MGTAGGRQAIAPIFARNKYNRIFTRTGTSLEFTFNGAKKKSLSQALLFPLFNRLI